jgi:iron complex transport system substrate-binding protein
MSRRRLLAFAAAALALAALSEAGTPAPRPAPPRRIASMNLAADEILVELVAPDRFVAATTFADEPELSNVVGRIPKSATRILHAKVEPLVALEPDLVVVSDFSDADFLHLLTASKLRYTRLGGLDSFEGIRKGILGLAATVGADEKGESLVSRLDADLAGLDRRLKGAARPRVLWWNDPDTAGTGTLLDAVITRAGGRNVAAELGVTSVRPVGAERALLADPDVFLVAAGGDRAKLLAHPVLKNARAVRAGRIVEMPGPLLSTITHHAARSAWFLAHALHPRAVPSAEPAP